MVATVVINRVTGPTCAKVLGVISAGVNTRLNAADTNSPTCTANPIIIDACCTVYSYWAITRLQATIAPDTLINNIRWFTDGTNSYGCAAIDLQVGQSACYTQATGACGSGTLLNDTNYTTGTLAPACPGVDNAFAFTSCAPLAVTGCTSTAVEFGNYVIMQLSALTTATPGKKPSATTEVITWRFDET